jgi:hypothetical protein
MAAIEFALNKMFCIYLYINKLCGSSPAGALPTVEIPHLSVEEWGGGGVGGGDEMC